MVQYSGIMPAQGAIATELSAITREAFIPKTFVQIWQASPLLAALLGTTQIATGGFSSIAAPVQGTPMTSGQWTNYAGTFNQPGVVAGIQNAEFNLSGYTVAIPFLGMEGLVQLDYAIIPLIEARMNDATNVAINDWSYALYNNATNTQQLIGLPGAVDDGTFNATYGGISHSVTSQVGANTVSWGKSTYVSNSGSAVTPTRNQIMQYILQITKKNGEMPKIGIMGPGTWGKLSQDFTSLEQYNVTPGGAYGDTTGGSALFQAIKVAGVPIYCDPLAPEGTLWLLNTDYLSMYMHERAQFEFSGFESTIPNGQWGYIGAILTLLQLVNVKPQSQGRFDNLSYLSI